MTIDRDKLKALLVELLEEIRLEKAAGLAGAQLEFQLAMEKIRDGLGGMFGAWGSLGTTQAASVTNLAFDRIEAQVEETAALKEEVHDLIERVEARQDAGDTRLVDARLENTILFGIGNEERDAATGQVDELNRRLTQALARIDRLEQRTGFLSDGGKRE